MKGYSKWNFNVSTLADLRNVWLGDAMDQPGKETEGAERMAIEQEDY